MVKTVVFLGGNSCENQISILTGIFVLSLLDREKYSPIPVYIDVNGNMYTSDKMFLLKTFKDKDFSSFKRVCFDNGRMYVFNSSKKKIKDSIDIDVAVNCCHGGWGEGGGLSALMEINNIPCTFPDYTTSGIFMDKSITKLIAKSLGLPYVEYIKVNECDYRKRGKFLIKNIYSRLKYPVVIKPAHLGSSIGIKRANDENEAVEAIEEAFELDDKIIIEKYIENKKDINCAAYSLNGEIFISSIEEVFGNELYSFESKYLKEKKYNKKDRTIFTSEKDKIIENKIRSYTKTIYKRMNLKGIVRVDYLCSEGKIYLSEVNTIPGSLAYYLFVDKISEAKMLFSNIIDDAIKNNKKNKKIYFPDLLNSIKSNTKNGGIIL